MHLSKNTAPGSKTAIIYVTRDIERALGMLPETHRFDHADIDFDYYIITNTTDYSRSIQSAYAQYVFLCENNEERLLDTHEILQLSEVENHISNIASRSTPPTAPHIVVFKNTPQIEQICTEKNWHLLNPSAELAEQIENKVSQVSWLADCTRFLPTHAIMPTKEIDLSKNIPTEIRFPFILQWAHSHTGLGTTLVHDQKALEAIKAKFPDREARVTEYINGPMFTQNICVTPEAIILGNISYQITGMLPFTDNPFSTVGNDWSLPYSLLAPKQIDAIHAIARAVGARMRASGWRGLFGIDCIWDENRDEIYLIEVNARQPASTTYESQLQAKIKKELLSELDNTSTPSLTSALTIFESHILALLSLEKMGAWPTGSINTIEINDGAQIIERMTAVLAKTDLAHEKEKAAHLRSLGYTVIEYANRTPHSDLLRIQSDRGIIETHNKLNKRGKEIVDTLLDISPSN